MRGSGRGRYLTHILPADWDPIGLAESGGSQLSYCRIGPYVRLYGCRIVVGWLFSVHFGGDGPSVCVYRRIDRT